MYRLYLKCLRLDWTPHLKASIRMIAYLGRYGPGIGYSTSGQPLEEWSIRKIAAYYDAIADIVKKESKT